MKIKLLLSTAFLILTVLFNQTIAQIPSAAGFHHLTMVHDSVARNFLVVVPNSYNASIDAPLMFCFHGGTQNIQSFVYSQIDSVNWMGREELWEKADSNGIVLVFPEALVNNISGNTLWNDKDLFPQDSSPYDDLGFVLHLIDTLVQDLSIDTSRIYGAGFSNGGDFTHLIGSQLPCKFAALTVVAGRTANQVSQIDTTLLYYPTPSVPVSMMIVRGKQDPEVVYFGGLNNNGTNTTSFFDDMNFWLNGNNCNNGLWTSSNIGDTVEIRNYYQCSLSTHLKVVSLKFMDHKWPDANDNFYWNANTEIIDFCLQFTNVCAATGITEIGNSNEYLLFPNPFSEQTTLQSDRHLKNVTLTLYNYTGQIVKQLNSISGQTITLYRDKLPSGLYFVRVSEDNKIIATKKLIIQD